MRPHLWDSTGVGCHFLLQRFFHKWKVKVKSLSHVQLFATPWTAAYQAPLSMGFSRQEYWSGVPLPSPSEWVRENIKKENKSPSFYPQFSLLKIWWTNSEVSKLFCQDFPTGPVVMIQLAMQGTCMFLFGQLSSHMPRGNQTRDLQLEYMCPN